MTHRLLVVLVLGASLMSARGAVDTQPATSAASSDRLFRQRYIELTNSWARDVEFTPEEVAAMSAGKQVEEVMRQGPDDPLVAAFVDIVLTY